LPVYGFAQLHQSGRLEFPIASEDDSYDVVPVKETGLVLHRRVFTNFGDHLEMIYIDTTLQEQWRGMLPLENNFALGSHAVGNGKLYLAYYSNNSLYRDLLLYTIDLKLGNFSRSVIRNSIPFAPTTLEVTAEGALMAGYFIRVPIVIFFEFGSQKSRILPGLFNEAGELLQIKVNPDQTFDVLISAKNYQRQQTLWIKNYDAHGKLIRNFMLKPEGDNNLIFGRTVQTNNNTQLIAGVYGTKNGEFSRGLFIAQINDNNIQQINYFSFGDLENFFRYMKARQEKRIKNRVQRKKVKGKKIKFQYRFIVHELVPYNNQFILLGEAFYKRYKTLGNTMAMPNSSEPPVVFDGYQYTHAAVLGIGANGNLLWDNSFEINDVKTFTLEQFVKMGARGNEIALLYLFDNKIRTKIIKNNEVLEGKTYRDLQLKENESLSVDNKSSINKLDYWYANYFLAYGTQNVVSIAGGRKKKKVFFINKISSDP
jgi:hypothetical protein